MTYGSTQNLLRSIFQTQVEPQKERAVCTAHHRVRKISNDGVSFHAAYLEGLTELPRPETAKQLQHLLSALNWIRSTIPDYGRNVVPVRELLKR